MSPAKILTSTEPWVEYQLEDGTVLRFRFTACNFRKTGKTTEQGDPEYSFSHSLLCETHVPTKEPVRLIYARSDKDVSGAEAVKALVASIAPSEYVAPVEDCG